MAKRKNLTKKTRFEVFKRDHFTCQYCGRTPPAVVLEIDHVTPVADGGDNDQINLLTSCFDCNRGKADRSLNAVPAPLAEQIALETERREQVKLFNEFLLSARADTAAAVERLGFHWFNGFAPDKDRWVFGDKRQVSIRTFLKWLAEAELMDFMERAQAKINASMSYDEKAFRYFCGICWNEIRQRRGDQ